MDIKSYRTPFLIYFATFICLVFTYGVLCHFYISSDNSLFVGNTEQVISLTDQTIADNDMT